MPFTFRLWVFIETLFSDSIYIKRPTESNWNVRTNPRKMVLNLLFIFLEKICNENGCTTKHSNIWIKWDSSSSFSSRLPICQSSQNSPHHFARLCLCLFSMRCDVMAFCAATDSACEANSYRCAYLQRSECCRVLPAQTFSFPNLTFWLKVCFLLYIYFHLIIFYIFSTQKLKISSFFVLRTNRERLKVEWVARAPYRERKTCSNEKVLRTVHAHRGFCHIKSIEDEKKNRPSILLRTVCDKIFGPTTLHLTNDFSVLILVNTNFWSLFLALFLDSHRFFHFVFPSIN